jgi:cyclase
MLKKRLIGVVTVKNGWAVQSFRYSKYLPLGKPECLIENFDRWGVDEILVQVIDCSLNKKGPDFALVHKLANLGLKTPLIYSGGIRSVSDAVHLIQSGADRIVIDTLLRDSIVTAKKISENLGAQALIASLPLSEENNNLVWYDYKKRVSTSLTVELLEFIQSDWISEIMISDWKHEGLSNTFNKNIIEIFPFDDMPMILFGGISESNQMQSLLSISNVMAIAIGNFLSYREHAIQNYKNKIHGIQIRPANYESNLITLAENYE